MKQRIHWCSAFFCAYSSVPRHLGKKREAGNAACKKRGLMRRWCWHCTSSTTLSDHQAVLWVSFTNCQKMGVSRITPQIRRVAPSPRREHPEFGLRSLCVSSPRQPNVRQVEQLMKKERSHPLLQIRRIHP